jgi:NDP-sugar pyrophosphorylase family protein
LEPAEATGIRAINSPAIVLAGGLGTRLRAVTHDRLSKPMVPVALDDGSVPFLEFPLAHLRSQGIIEVVICIGHIGEHIQQYFGDGSRFGLRITYDDAGSVLTGTRVRSAIRTTTASEVLVVCGDVYHPLDLRAFMNNFQRQITWSMQLAVRMGAMNGLANIAMDLDGRVISYESNGVQGVRTGLETGILALRPHALGTFSAKSDVSLTEDLYPALIARGTIGGFITKAEFFDIGTQQGYDRFCAYARRGGTVPISRLE